MTEEELKNKCKERAKIFQQAMESCKSSNPMDCIEWFADRIADLEKENAKLKSECRTCVYTDSPCVLSDYPSKNGVCSHYKNVFEENEELKEQHKVDLRQIQAILNQRSIQNKKLIKANCDLAIEGRDIKIMELEEENKRLLKENSELSARIERVITENAELKEENNKLLDVINNQDVEIADLEKRLKESEHNKKTVVHLSECISDIQDKQLEQAKKIINWFIQWNYGCCDIPDYKDIVKQAEQFLKENGGKK